METTNKLLDKYAKTCYAKNDKEIAARLRVTKQAVSGWRNAKARPDAESVEKMAQAIGEPVGPWLATIEAERARTPAGKMVWLRLAQTLGATAALATVAALPNTATAKAHSQTLPIVSNWRRRYGQGTGRPSTRTRYVRAAA